LRRSETRRGKAFNPLLEWRKGSALWRLRVNIISDELLARKRGKRALPKRDQRRFSSLKSGKKSQEYLSLVCRMEKKVWEEEGEKRKNLPSAWQLSSWGCKSEGRKKEE